MSINGRTITTTTTSWTRSYMTLIGQLVARRADLVRTRGPNDKPTQEWMAARLGVGVATFQRWENAVNQPKGMDLFRWAALLNIEITSKMMCSEG